LLSSSILLFPGSFWIPCLDGISDEKHWNRYLYYIRQQITIRHWQRQRQTVKKSSRVVVAPPSALMAAMRPMAPRSRLFPDDCRTQPTNQPTNRVIGPSKSNETLWRHFFFYFQCWENVFSPGYIFKRQSYTLKAAAAAAAARGQDIFGNRRASLLNFPQCFRTFKKK
jgi:hypothetical protein